jgi:CRISPR-associated protein Csm3
MRKLEDNFLGGYGSRGSGSIEFKEIKVVWRSVDYYKGSASEEILGERLKLSDIFEKIGEWKGKCS